MLAIRAKVLPVEVASIKVFEVPTVSEVDVATTKNKLGVPLNEVLPYTFVVCTNRANAVAIIATIRSETTAFCLKFCVRVFIILFYYLIPICASSHKEAQWGYD